MLKKHGVSDKEFDSVVLVKGNQYYLKSSAILHLLKDLGGFWKLFFIFIIIPPFIRDFAYKIVAKTRYKIFGRDDSCIC